MLPLLTQILLVLQFNLLSGSSMFDLSFIKMEGENAPTVIGSEFEYCRPIGTKRVIDPEPEAVVAPSTEEISIPQAVIPAISILPSPKKAKIKSISSILHLTPSIAAIIKYEMDTCGYRKPEKLQKLSQALESIAANDARKFLDDESGFLETFKVKRIDDFEKDGMNGYLVKFMILFGADKFFKFYSRDFVKIPVDMDLIRYLIATKPLDTILNTLLGFRNITYTAEMMQEITQLLNAKYPEMNYFRKLALSMLQMNYPMKNWSCNILGESDLDSFKALSAEIPNQLPHFFELLSQSPFERPDLYVQCTEAEKFEFIRTIIVRDDLKQFEDLIDLDADMVNYTFKIKYQKVDEEENRFSLIDACIASSAAKCFACLLDIAPESVGPRTLRRAIKGQNENILDNLITTLGLGLDTLITEQHSNTTTTTQYKMIQFAFLARRANSLNYFVTKYGVERVKADIAAVWKSKESIVLHSTSGGDIFVMHDDLTDFIFDVLGIKAADKYNYRGKTGDISILLIRPNSSIRARLLKETHK